MIRRYLRRWLAIFLAVQMAMMPVRQAQAQAQLLLPVILGVVAVAAVGGISMSANCGVPNGYPQYPGVGWCKAFSDSSNVGAVAPVTRIEVQLQPSGGTPSSVKVPATASAPAVPAPTSSTTTTSTVNGWVAYNGAPPSYPGGSATNAGVFSVPNGTACNAANYSYSQTAPGFVCKSVGTVTLPATPGGSYSIPVTGRMPSWSSDSTANFTIYASIVCPSGSSFASGTTCTITDQRQFVQDDSEDYVRSGTTLSKYAQDLSGPQYPMGIGKQETTSATNDTVSVTGRDSNGNTSKVSVIANADGGSTVQVDTQKVDPNGTSYIDRQTVKIDANGNITGTQRAPINPGSSIGVTPGTTGQTPSGTIGPGTPGSVFTPGTGSGGTGSGFPSDYARAGEADAAATKLGTKLDILHKDLSDTTNQGDPDIPGDGDYTSVQDQFSGLLGWQVPGHTSTCPAWSFDFNGHTYATTTHCDLFNNNAGTFHTAMAVVWTIAALFIVLGA